MGDFLRTICERLRMKIRKKVYPSGAERWCVDLGLINGKRVERFYKTKDLAEAELERAQAELKESGHSVGFMAPADRMRIALAVDKLAAAGATIEQAVDFYIRHHSPTSKARPMKELSEEWLFELERLKKSPRYLALTRLNLARFCSDSAVTEAHAITREIVERWVAFNRLAPATQANRLATVRGFLNWAKRRKYISLNPLDGDPITLPDTRPDEIEAYSVAECRALLRTCLFGKYDAFSVDEGFHEDSFHALLGYLVVGLFCGVRPAEIRRTHIDRLDLHGRTLAVVANAAKAKKRRVIELPRVAVVWLRLWRRLGPWDSFVPPNFDKRWVALREAAGIGDWIHDGLRHTFATYHYSAHQNEAQLKALMGHSKGEDVLFEHYRAVTTRDGRPITRKSAAEFWELTPRRVKAPTK